MKKKKSWGKIRLHETVRFYVPLFPSTWLAGCPPALTLSITSCFSVCFSFFSPILCPLFHVIPVTAHLEFFSSSVRLLGPFVSFQMDFVLSWIEIFVPPPPLSLPPCHPLRPTLTNQLQKHPSPFFPPGCESVPYRVKCTIRKTETHWPIRLLNGTGRQWKLIQKWLTRVVFITLDCFERKNQFENNYNHGFLTDNWTILLFYGI